MLTYSIVTFLFTTYFGIAQSQLSAGDLCTISSSKSQGICKLFSDCEQARVDLQQNGIYPQTCGFQGSQPIICCKTTSTTTTTTARPKPSRKTGEISKQKCKEYTKYIVERKIAPVLIDEEPFHIETKECGHEVIELIVGGQRANRREFPHMAALGYEDASEIKWLCGGTIISEQYILTAGHCLSSLEYGSVKYVMMGVTFLKDRTKEKRILRVSERIAHPDYRSNSHYNDIALLKLEKPAKLNSYARPACLYKDHEIRAKKAIATGWGNKEHAGVASDDLLKVTLDLFDQPSCNYSYRRHINGRLAQGILDDSQICAGSKSDEVKDTCQGDSGGPLQIYHIGDDVTCMYDLVGVTSFGRACLGSPGVYTRVSNYLKWIEDIVWP